jgi:hypothetical protein
MSLHAKSIRASRAALLLGQTLLRFEILCLALLLVVLLPSRAEQAPSQLKVTDVSPDAPYGTTRTLTGRTRADVPYHLSSILPMIRSSTRQACIPVSGSRQTWN